MDVRKKRAFTTDEVDIICSLERMNDKEALALFYELRLKGGWVLEVISKRFDAHDLVVDIRIIIALLYIGNGTVGLCVRYVDDVAAWAKEFYHLAINFNQFQKEIYPFGLPIL